MNIIRAIFEYALLRGAELILKSVPLDTAYLVGKGIGILSFHIDRRHRRVGMQNLKMVFGQRKSRGERRSLLRKLYLHLGMVFVEMVRMTRLLRGNNHRRFIELVGFERVESLLATGRPVIFVTAHIGNWELLGGVMSVLYPKFYSIARTMDNPFIDRLLVKNRESVGMGVLKKHGSGRRLLDVLRGGGRIGILVDQNTPVDNIFVDFLGVKASTARAVPLLALKTNAAIMPGCCYRKGDGLRYVIEAGTPIYPDVKAEREAEVHRIAKEYTSQIERWIMAHPEQWLWLHRRWKTRPPEEEDGKRV
ncbi:MAG: lysophospholipid acyltransferase family protein [Planctomycetota bacterium]|nr:lysophospholipid acyltransferase family protein [Planctomycetota bacterium]